MKIFITGASGLLGRSIMKELRNQKDLQIRGAAFSSLTGDLVKLDLLDRKSAIKTIGDYSPDLIIHCAAERRPDVCKAEPGMAEKLNVSAVETICDAASQCGSKVLFISTDYVFDGTNPPYFTDSETNPLNFYGKMKLAGEKILTEDQIGSIILRVPILYGPVEYLGESAVTQIAEKLIKEKISSHDNEAVRYPTNTEEIARVINEMIGLIKEGQKIEGIYHWSGEEAFTKYTMALVMGEILGIDKKNIKIAEADPHAAPRPHDAHLDSSRLLKLGIQRDISFRSAIEEIIKERTLV